MLKKILIAIAVLIVALVGIAYLLPKQVAVERSIVINRAPEQIFPLVNSWARFNEWSPWFKLDPAATYERTGPAEGVGAANSWRGNAAVGVGKTAITQSVPPQRVDVRLEFEGMPPSSYWIALQPEGGATRVVWHLDSDMGNNPIGRWFGLALDNMVGKDYEAGLQNLKALAEKN
jgi:hypothetical protein